MFFIDGPSFTPCPSAAWEINNAAEQLSPLRPGSLRYVSLLIDVMTTSWYPLQNRANQSYKYFNFSRDYMTVGGAVSINAGKYESGLECTSEGDFYDNFKAYGGFTTVYEFSS